MYADSKESTAKWQDSIGNLEEGDYVIYAVSEDLAKNTSEKSKEVKFTIESVIKLVPVITSPGNDQAITTTSNPEIRGKVDIPEARILVFNDGSYIGDTISDTSGKFVYKQVAALPNGYHNLRVQAYKNGQYSELSDVVSFELRVKGAPSATNLTIETKGKTFSQLKDIYVVVKDKNNQPISNATVWISETEKKTTDTNGNAFIKAPTLQPGKNIEEALLKAEKKNTTEGTLYGSMSINIVDNESALDSFSPNNDGQNEYFRFKRDDLPVNIYTLKGGVKVKEISQSSDGQWDGRTEWGAQAEPGMYRAETKGGKGRKVAIQLQR